MQTVYLRFLKYLPLLSSVDSRKLKCCSQLWVRHMFCDELYHFIFSTDCDYTQKSTISTLAVKLSVSAIYYPQVDCHIKDVDWVYIYMSLAYGLNAKWAGVMTKLLV